VSGRAGQAAQAERSDAQRDPRQHKNIPIKKPMKNASAFLLIADS
jgi:hypothetical protein